MHKVSWAEKNVQIFKKLEIVIIQPTCTFCVEWNEIAIKICRGNPGSPPIDPSDYCQYLRYDSQNFFGKKHTYLLIWPTRNFGQLHFRPKVQALEKKKWKMTIVFYPSDQGGFFCRIPENRRHGAEPTLHGAGKFSGEK